MLVPIERIIAGRGQPRRKFDDEPLDELAASIRENGIIQPLVVVASGGSYELIAGERRLRAAVRAGLDKVPVVVRDTTTESGMLELALVENLQRADLDPIEAARAFSELIAIRGYSQEQLAERVGKDRSSISNAMRLLRLPEKVQELVREGRLSMGHARALLGLEREPEIAELASEVVKGDWSVRATERAVRSRIAEAKATPRTADDEAQRRKIIVSELEHRLRRRLGTKVRLRTDRRQRGAGVVEIPYGSLDELDRLLHILLDDLGGLAR
jgi:ParB family chromosome partitioning protein